MSEKEIEIKRIKRAIRNGELPRFFLVKDEKNDKFLQRSPRKGRRSGRILDTTKLTWKQVSTLAFLTKDLK